MPGLVRSDASGRTVRYFADMTGFRDLLAYLMEDCCNGATGALPAGHRSP